MKITNKIYVLSGDSMTIKELIGELQKYPEDMEVMCAEYIDIEEVFETTWEHTNYPYDKPDKQVVIIL